MATRTVAHPEVPFSLVGAVQSGRLDFTLHGELDLATSDLLHELAGESEPDVRRVTLDITDLEFIDSIGVTALMDVRTRNQGLGRSVEMTNPTSLVRRVIGLLGREEILAPG
jgi:anti-sigma B factor antagonist